MAQAQGSEGGQGGIRRWPKWMTKRRIILLALMVLLLPGIGWLTALVLIVWWAKSTVSSQK